MGMLDWAKCSRRKRHRGRTSHDLGVTTKHGLSVTLALLQRAVTGIGVPGLEPTVNGVVGVLELMKDVEDNANDLTDLNGLLATLANAISFAPNLHPEIEDVPKLLRSRVDDFLLDLHRMLMEVNQMLGDKNPIIRAANSQAHKNAITDINAKLNRLLSQFNAQGTLLLELDVAGARQDIRYVIQAQKAQEYENLLNAIPRAHARYRDTSTKPSRSCHPGTRTDLLRTIRAWIYGGFSTTPYFWLCGEVGVGKTTVAHTIAQENEALQQLGASFFFSRHDEKRRSPELLFTSIAYQLARFDPRVLKALVEVLKPDPDIVNGSPMEQFKRLVLEPLSRSGIGPSQTVVIVIDGLDECSDPALVLDVLTLGIDDAGVRLRVLISSRPYAAILSKFKDPRLYQLSSETQFRDINPTTLSSDVAIYLSWSLGDLALRWQLPSPWPPKAQLDELIERAGGLIIVASTYTKYIDDPEEGNPLSQLARILSRERRLGRSPLAELDALYDQVLDDLKSKLPLEVTNARDIIAFVVLAPMGINVSALAGLFHVDPSYVRSILRRLTAVILLPEKDDGTIAPFHASFGEYVQDATRCTVWELSVDRNAACGRIVARCFDIMASAAADGITGVEYHCARGYSWTPKHFRHVGGSLTFYLSHSPSAQVEEAKRTFTEKGVWTLLDVGVLWETNDERRVLVDAVGGFEYLPPIEGSSNAERAASLGRLMIDHHVSAINRMSENAAIEIPVEAPRHGRRQALKFVEMADNDWNDEVQGALNVVRDVRCWTKHTHTNVMSFKGVDVKFDERNVPQEVLTFLASPSSSQHCSSLRGYLERNSSLDLTSGLRMALGIADGLHHLHGSSPPQPHNGINPYQIMVSGEGRPILYPSKWILDFQSRLPLSDQHDIDEIECRWDFRKSPVGWYHWNPIENPIENLDTWQRSLEARLHVDVWDFGSILYQMVTGEEPLTIYNRLAKGDTALDYDSAEFQRCLDEGDSAISSFWPEPRYKAAVPLLLDTIEVSEAVKELLGSCWTIRQEDRPPMNEVFERLKVVINDMDM